jgi:hypothetical protein
MLFFEKKSALVRLSDCIKFGVGNSLDTTKELLEVYENFEEPLHKMRIIAKDISEEKLPAEEGERKILEIQKSIPEKEATRAAFLQGQLHNSSSSCHTNHRRGSKLESSNFLKKLPGCSADLFHRLVENQ